MYYTWLLYVVTLGKKLFPFLLTNIYFLQNPQNADETLATQIEGIDTNVARIDTKVGRIDTKVGRIDTKVGGIDTKVGGIDTQVDNLQVIIWVIYGTLSYGGRNVLPIKYFYQNMVPVNHVQDLKVHNITHKYWIYSKRRDFSTTLVISVLVGFLARAYG